MSSEVKITKYSNADDTDLRALEVDIGSKTIKTPAKALITNDFFKDTIFPPEFSNLHESFLRFDEKSLISMDEDKKYSMKKNNDIFKYKVKANNCPSICITEFKSSGNGNRYPNPYEIETLSNIAYSFSDITPIPSVPKMVRNINKDNFEDFLTYLRCCYEAISVRNKKKIMGYMPTVTSLYTKKIVDFYVDNGINSFYIDFDGTMVKSHLDSLNTLKRQLAKRGYEENNFIYYINVSYGKSINDQNVLSARDLLAFGHGLDGLGGIHVSPKRNKEFYEWLKKQKDINRNTTRILNRNDYGYYRLDTLDENLIQTLPEDTFFDIDSLKTESSISRIKRLVNIVNLQQQCVESDVLKDIVQEEQEKSLNYFKSKRNVTDTDLKNLSKKGGF